MALDVNRIHTFLVRTANKAVGHLLSATSGAVIKETQSKQRPKYPYITVSFPNIRDESGWELGNYVNDNCQITSTVNKHLEFTFSALGEDSVSILNTLQGYFRRAYVRDTLRCDPGIGIVEWGQIRSLPTIIADKNYVDKAEFTLTVNAVDVDTITEEDENNFIEAVSLEGELFRHEEDPDPLEMNITAGQFPEPEPEPEPLPEGD